jgi:hypothetical protein
MEVGFEKEKPDEEIVNILKALKYPNSSIKVIGTASLKGQKYPSDYDIITNVKEKDPERVYNTFKKIINKTNKMSNVYFIELKIQGKTENDKKKFFDNENIPKDEFINQFNKGVEFIKIDYVVRFGNNFKDVSVNYFFNTELTREDIFHILLTRMNNDAREYRKEGRYFKALKRIFNIYRYLRQKRSLVKLAKFFNSEYGRLYALSSNLKTIKLLVESGYRDADTRSKILINLKDIGIEPDITKINDVIEKTDKIFNDKAKEYFIENGININKLKTEIDDVGREIERTGIQPKKL